MLLLAEGYPTASGATATAAQAVAATVWRWRQRTWWYERAVVVTLGRGALWGAMLLAALQQLDGLHHAVCNGGLHWGHKPASYLHIFISARVRVRARALAATTASQSARDELYLDFLNI